MIPATLAIQAAHYSLDVRLKAAVIVAVLFIFVGGVVRPLWVGVQIRWLRHGRADEKLSDAERSRFRGLEALRSHNPLSVIIGQDGRLSTSKAVALAWTLVASYIVAALILVWPASWDDAFTNLTPTYLLLLAGPYGSLVLSKGIVSYRTTTGSLVKPANNGSARLSDLTSDDTGDVDVFDVQFLMFNALALWFVVDAFNRATSQGFPEVPSGLLLLTGGPAAVYLSNKTFGGGSTDVKSVTPPRLFSNFTFAVLGTGFLDGHPGGGQPGSLTLNGFEVETTLWTDTRITAKAPSLPESDGVAATLTVTTPGGNVGTLPNALTVDQRPRIAGFDHEVAAPGQEVVMLVDWPPSTKINSMSTVECGGILLQGPLVGPGTHYITFTVPDVPAGTSKLTIVVHGSGRSSDPMDLDLTALRLAVRR